MAKLTRESAHEWAKGIVVRGDNVLVLDTETTGKPIREAAEVQYPEVIELAMVNFGTGEIVYNSRLDPRYLITKGATEVHGISKAMLAGCPVWRDEWEKLQGLMKGRELIAYNREFDLGCIRKTCFIHHVELAPPGERLSLHTHCAMLQYAAWFGEKGKFGDWKWQRLVQWGDLPAHAALGDVLATIRLIHIMAKYPEPPAGWPDSRGAEEDVS